MPSRQSEPSRRLSPPRPHPKPECILRKQLKCVLIFSCVLVLSGCEGAKLSCTSPDATQLLEKIVREQIGKNIMVDSQNTKIKVGAIKTLAAENKKASCAAELNFDVALRNGSDDPDQQRVKAAIEDRSNTSIEYTIEKPDNGEIYISVSGLVAW